MKNEVSKEREYDLNYPAMVSCIKLYSTSINPEANPATEYKQSCKQIY